MGVQFVAYILYSPSRDRYYVGQTSDFVQRAEGHMAGKTQSTKTVKDWELVFMECTGTLQQAMALERKIKKSKSRKSMGRYICDARNVVREAVPLAELVSGQQGINAE